jgi:hypothetical protein
MLFSIHPALMEPLFNSLLTTYSQLFICSPFGEREWIFE